MLVKVRRPIGICSDDGAISFAIDVAKGLRGANRWPEVQCDAAVTEAAALMQPAAKMLP